VSDPHRITKISTEKKETALFHHPYEKKIENKMLLQKRRRVNKKTCVNHWSL